MKRDTKTIKKIGLAIKKARKKRGWTQQDLAEYLGCHFTLIQKWESGKREPGSVMLLKINKLFGLEIMQEIF